MAGIVNTLRGDTIFNCVIPIALIVFAAKYTERLTSDEKDPTAVLASAGADRLGS